MNDYNTNYLLNHIWIIFFIFIGLISNENNKLDFHRTMEEIINFLMYIATSDTISVDIDTCRFMRHWCAMSTLLTKGKSHYISSWYVFSWRHSCIWQRCIFYKPLFIKTKWKRYAFYYSLSLENLYNVSRSFGNKRSDLSLEK